MLSRIRLISRAYASKIFTAALIVGILCEEGYGGINWHEIQVPEGEIIVCEHAQKSFSYGPTRMLK